MSRPDTAELLRRRLARSRAALQHPARRSLLLLAAALVLVAQAWTGAAALSWLTAVVVLLSGLSGGARFGLLTGVGTGVAHAVVDLVQAEVAVQAAQVLGWGLRLGVLSLLGVLGATVTRIEVRHDKALTRAVTEDPVTGLLNVRAFYDELAGLRAQHTPFTILLADIRGMRRLNERYGHPTGTEAMRAVAHVLRRTVGPEVLASRLGSDELAVALVGGDQDRCGDLVDSIVARLHEEQVALPDGELFEVHAAYGLASYPQDGEDEIALLRAAERAKDLAKIRGIDQASRADGRAV